jgi:hypothetical protein
MSQKISRSVPGFLSKSFLCPKMEGAHPVEHVRLPDWNLFERWQDAAGGRIRIVTLAPELPGAIEFIERAAQSGIVVAIGHTAAEPKQINAAVKAGARLSTHLGNGTDAILRRHPNHIWEQLASEISGPVSLPTALICLQRPSRAFCDAKQARAACSLRTRSRSPQWYPDAISSTASMSI